MLLNSYFSNASSALSCPSISSKISLSCLGMSRALSFLEVPSQTSSPISPPPSSLEKKKPACIHISNSHCHSQPKNYPYIYITLFPKQTTNMYFVILILHTDSFLIIQLEPRDPIIYPFLLPQQLLFRIASVLLFVLHMYIPGILLFIPFCVAVG